MMPEKQPNEEFVILGVRWTPGGFRLAVTVVAALAGGGVVKFWDQIARALSMAPVAAFVAVLSCIVYPPVSQASDLPTIRLAALQSVGSDYAHISGLFQ